jgi:sulfatase maturation enzyme AslB (radical SAM superfamily)
MSDSYFDLSGFCVLPFTHQMKFSDGSVSVCCYGRTLQSDFAGQDGLGSFNSATMKSIRDNMLSGNSPSQCSNCYTMEKSGMTSPRQIENNAWKYAEDQVNSIIADYTVGKAISPISYDLRYSNTCTLKCRMCNSSSSSAINSEYSKLQQIWPQKFWTANNPRTNHDVDLTANIHKIYLAGGEPMVEPYNYKLLDTLSQTSPDMSIVINTSLNILSDKMVEILNRFTNLTLAVSIDGTGVVNDYIRNGSNFDSVIKNIELMKHHNMIFVTIVSPYNIFNLPNLIRYLQNNFPEHSQNHGINLVNDIEELMIDVIPPELRNEIINNLLSAESSSAANIGIQNVISILKQDNFNPDRFENFKKYTKILDQIRNESINEVVPELSNYFNDLP